MPGARFVLGADVRSHVIVLCRPARRFDTRP